MTRHSSALRERRRKIRRHMELRLLRIVMGECDNVTWEIDPKGDSQKPTSCGKCLPCRVRATLGLRVLEEILDDLESRGSRRTLNERRRRIESIRTERRRKTVHRR